VHAFGNHELGIPYQTIADLLATYRARDAAKSAIVDVDQQSTINFGELDQMTTDVAVFLKMCGVTKGSRILVLSPERIEKLLIWLGAWRMGAAICPFNIEVNASQLADLAAKVNPALILYDRDVAIDKLITDRCAAPRIRFGRWSPCGTHDPQDEFFRALPRGSRAADVSERNGPEDVAALFCTSGTTARPKIVVYNHATYWMNGLDTLDFFGLTENDRTLEYRSFGWNSAQVASLMPFLIRGLTLHIAKRFSHSRFFDWIESYGITFAVSVPTVLNMLLTKPVRYAPKQETLRLMSCSAAPLTAQQWMQFEELYGIKIVQYYGVSETGVVCGNRHYQRKVGTVGRPALHQELRIVDATGQACLAGVEGEVTVGGPKLAMGYLRDDGSMDALLGTRMATGDLAVQDAEGFVRVTGRTKDLIIRGGVKIAPLEIEEIVLNYPGVLEAAAIGVPDVIYGEEVVCFVVASEQSITEKAILDHCRSYLPEAKAPKQIRFTSDLPRSDRGKVLRDKLKEDWIGKAVIASI